MCLSQATLHVMSWHSSGCSWRCCQRNTLGISVPADPNPVRPLLPLVPTSRVGVQYPAGELPRYPKSSTHLKGRDAWLQDRVTALPKKGSLAPAGLSRL